MNRRHIKTDPRAWGIGSLHRGGLVLRCSSHSLCAGRLARCAGLLFGVHNFLDKAKQHNSHMGELAFSGRTDQEAMTSARNAWIESASANAIAKALEVGRVHLGALMVPHDELPCKEEHESGGMAKV